MSDISDYDATHNILRELDGEFKAHGHSAPDNVVSIVPYLQVNEHTTPPQANDIEKVAMIPDCVAGGATTAQAIAEVFDFTERQGAYYLSAARHIGLVDTEHEFDGSNVYSLTMAGNQFLASTNEERMEALADVVNRSDATDTLLTDGYPALVEMFSDELDTTTAERRAMSWSAWVNATQDGAGLRKLEETRPGALALVGAAAARAKEDRAVRRAAHDARYAEKKTVQCNDCFMVLPTSGICGNC